jgi:hypothetical protein
MNLVSLKRAAGVVFAGALVLTASACLLSPGKFASNLDIRKDGNFRFQYNGELVFEPLTEKPKPKAKFEPRPCYDYAEDGEEESKCDAAELAEQKSIWDEQQDSKAAQEKREAASAKAFFGGIDPSDPKAGAELADKIRRQAGWNTVEYRGNGVFDVEFAISSTLDHAFVFPTIEGFSMANTFVQLGRRDDGTVRIDAPGFGPPTNPMAMAGMPMGGGNGSPNDGSPTMDGQFTIRTDAAILANNTDEGPSADPAGQRLDWNVSATTSSAPTALLRLTN